MHTARAIEDTTSHPLQTTGPPAPPQVTPEWTQSAPRTDQLDTPKLAGIPIAGYHKPVLAYPCCARDIGESRVPPAISTPISEYHALYCVNTALAVSFERGTLRLREPDREM